MTESLVALDRSPSSRSYDRYGHLSVKLTPISKATVNPYKGREIPRWRELSLDEDRVYQLLRDPDELRKGAKTFEGKPLLLSHQPLNSNAHPHEMVVGSVGHGAVFDPPYLKAPVTVWDQVAIDGIEDDSVKEISSSYGYRADMTPGSYNGVAYDGVMRDIVANHVSLVPRGRAGSDVVIGDAIPSWLVGGTHMPVVNKSAKKVEKVSRAALLATGALSSYFRPFVAQDKALDLSPVLNGVTARNLKTRIPEIKAALKKATQGILAQDYAEGDVEQILGDLAEKSKDVVDVLAPEGSSSVPLEEGSPGPGKQPAQDEPLIPKAEGEGEGDDPPVKDDSDKLDKVMKALSEMLTPEQMETIKAICGKGDPDNSDPSPPPSAQDRGRLPPLAQDKRQMITKPAMDAALKEHGNRVRRDTLNHLRALQEAERVVLPLIGEIAQDSLVELESAENVYKFALEQLGMDGLDEIHPSAYKALVAQRVAIAATPAPAPERLRETVAQDSAIRKSVTDRFGKNAARLGRAATV